MKDIVLSKTKIKAGFNCSKALYLDIFQSDQKSHLSPFEQRILQHGITVGEAARNQFPEGILVDELSTNRAIEKTNELIAQGVEVLFEPAFQFENVLIRADVLKKNKDGSWDIIEVKATSYNKPAKDDIEEYILDISIQAWVLENLGFSLSKSYLMHLNSNYIHPDTESLFSLEEFTDKVNDCKPSIPEKLPELMRCLETETVPSVPISKKCDNPYTCRFKKLCWQHVPEISIFDIPNSRKKWELYQNGYLDIHSLDKDDFKSEIQKRMIEVSQTGIRYIDSSRISEMLESWENPLIYLDFEAIDFAIPKYNNTRPYQHIPFQFSCHIEDGQSLVHHEYLHTDNSDPREDFIQKLISVIPFRGSIVVYHQTYEETRLKDLARDFPEYSNAILQIQNRLVDLLDVVKECVYDINFKGSLSIKAVAPALLGKEASYENLAIRDGAEAMVAYERLVDSTISTEEKRSLRQNMLDYCCQDTLLMVKLVQWLKVASKFH